MPASLSLSYIDEFIVVAEKPTLLLSVPGRGADKQDSVVTRLALEYPGIREVHRLDWETSGLMLLARTPEAHRELSRQFREREVSKSYIAVVFGELVEEEGSIALPLRADWPNRPRQIVDLQQGKPSLTHWRRLGIEDGHCRVALTPVTGRTHQLRVHMDALGHPILGDRLYADAQALAQAPRLLLHATALDFLHPGSGKMMKCRSEAPF